MCPVALLFSQDSRAFYQSRRRAFSQAFTVLEWGLTAGLGAPPAVNVSFSASSAMIAKTHFLSAREWCRHLWYKNFVCLVLSFDITCVSLPLPELTAQDRYAQSQGIISGGFQT